MATDRSFRDYVAEHFYSKFQDAICDFIGDDIDSLDLHLSRVRTVGDWEISDLTVRSVSVDDLPGMEVRFDALVDAEFYIREADYHYDTDEEAHQWFMVRCMGDLEQNLKDLRIIETTVYDRRHESSAPLSDSLVPIIYSKDMETAAEDFLKRYYPEALRTPMPVDPMELAKKMGLRVEVRQITEDFSVFGQIFFCDTIAEIYNRKTMSMEMAEIKGRTIVVDPQNFFMRNLGSTNNTIVHECVHWDKHRKAFQLERLYNQSATQIRCQVTGGVKDRSARSATDWMEWQANTLAPKIQMPLTAFKIKAAEVVRKYRRAFNTDELIDVLEAVIDELATFYTVSRLAAKIRLIDAGYSEAIGVYEYVDGSYVKPHRFRKNAIQNNQTFSIGFNDALVESIFSPQLSEKVKSGNYLFVDSHFCLNHPKYIKKNEYGQAELTRYARCHMDECCLIFDLEIKSADSYGKQFFTECVLYRDAASNITFIPHYSDSNRDNPNHAKMIQDYNRDLLEVLKTLPMSFSGALDKLIDWTGMKEEELVENSKLSEKTIQRLRNHEPDNVTIETLTQLCLGMQLPPQLSSRLIQAAGKSFMMTEQHLMYQFLLNSCYTCTIDECNAYLESQGMTPFGRKPRKDIKK